MPYCLRAYPLQAEFNFASAMLRWYDQNGRKDLPWQLAVTPYRVWVSEIMLQQTRVGTAIPYYTRFMQRFPTVAELAQAPLDDVLTHWSGLGYYARARNLHKAAQLVHDQYDGELPLTLEALCTLPGIARSTAAAILSLATGQSQAILDGNVKRVLARYFAIEGWPGASAVLKQLWRHAESLAPQQRCGPYNQALMDLGANVCHRRKPNCSQCPLQAHCGAYQQDKVAQLPHSKPKKNLPIRPRYLLFLLDPQGAVLLEKRPEIGIWGGLLSPPMFEQREDLDRWCRQHYGAVHCESNWPSLRHSLTHFHMDITPCIRRLRRAAEIGNGSTRPGLV